MEIRSLSKCLTGDGAGAPSSFVAIFPIKSVNAVVRDKTIWLTQKAMATLFDVQTPAISKHLKNTFEEGKLREEVVVSKMEITTPHGAMVGKPKQGRHNSDRTKEHMRLTTWANALDGRILKSDVLVAKNYLDEQQI